MARKKIAKPRKVAPRTFLVQCRYATGDWVRSAFNDKYQWESATAARRIVLANITPTSYTLPYRVVDKATGKQIGPLIHKGGYGAA